MTGNTKKLANAPTHDTGIYIGPGWIREGRRVDQPMLDKYEVSAIYDDAGTPPRRKRLTENEIVERAEARISGWHILAVATLLLLWTWWVVKSVANSIGQ